MGSSEPTPIYRRRFMTGAAGLAAVSTMGSISNARVDAKAFSSKRSLQKPDGFRFVATWPFGKFACQKALEIAKDKTMLDAIEQGIWVTESDIKNASVGIGGIPNANGDVELDACIMSGPGHAAGSVAGLQEILHPISVARCVMEKTPHVMLVGEGALNYAMENGFKKTQLLSEKQKARWEKWKAEKAKTQPKIDSDHHDTIAMLGIDPNGNLYGGCSTSGWGFKIPGRVGDSPIIGSGLYVDNSAGAAGATGLGENVMRYCGSFLVVEMMRNGASPVEACRQAIQRIAELDPKPIQDLNVNFVALNKAGEFGAAGTSKGFKYSVVDDHQVVVQEGASLSDKAIGPEGGNRK